jgi:hypothetical protein
MLRQSIENVEQKLLILTLGCITEKIHTFTFNESGRLIYLYYYEKGENVFLMQIIQKADVTEALDKVIISQRCIPYYRC